MLAQLEKLEANLGGVADMRRQPDAVFIVDLRKEQLAVREARRLGLQIVAIVDTNCDPDDSDLPIPGNDDAIRACDLITRAIADAIEEGRTHATPADFAPAAAPEAPPKAAEAPDSEPQAPAEAPEYEQLGQHEAAVEAPEEAQVVEEQEPVEAPQ